MKYIKFISFLTLFVPTLLHCQFNPEFQGHIADAKRYITLAKNWLSQITIQGPLGSLAKSEQHEKSLRLVMLKKNQEAALAQAVNFLNQAKKIAKTHEEMAILEKISNEIEYIKKHSTTIEL